MTEEIKISKLDLDDLQRVKLHGRSINLPILWGPAPFNGCCNNSFFSLENWSLFRPIKLVLILINEIIKPLPINRLQEI